MQRRLLVRVRGRVVHVVWLGRGIAGVVRHGRSWIDMVLRCLRVWDGGTERIAVVRSERGLLIRGVGEVMLRLVGENGRAWS